MNKPILSAVIAASCLLVGQYASAQSGAGSAAPDNAKSNKVDPSNMSATSDSQANNATDIDLTRRIRKSVIADKSLSTYAHNVKIVTVNGSVTLNGVVRSDEERNSVEMKAVAVAGKANVTDALKIAPSK